MPGENMLICLACYGERIAALLEGATELRFYAGKEGGGVREARPRLHLPAPLAEVGSCALIARMAEAGAATLACGGLTGCMRIALEQAGIRVEPWVGGTAAAVARAWAAGGLATMRLPGCGCGRRRRQNAGNCPAWKKMQKKEEPMQDKIVAVTSEGPLLTDMVDPRFGRAAGFVIADLATGETKYVDNGCSQSLSEGAGIQAAQNVARAGAGVVLSGFIGPKAFAALAAVGIKAVQGVEGLTVGQALDKYKKGELKTAEGPNARSGGRR